jgi:hypothetical protein
MRPKALIKVASKNLYLLTEAFPNRPRVLAVKAFSTGEHWISNKECGTVF